MKKGNIIKSSDINKDNPNTGVTILSIVLSSLGISLSTLVFSKKKKK
ncbi:NPXTG-anchored protein [Anaerococcus senegalensis]|nr:NPXTG-anchored protein [Anaerococcus senegalensis]